MATKKVEFVLSSKDEASRGISRVENNLKSLGKSAKDASGSGGLGAFAAAGAGAAAASFAFAVVVKAAQTAVAAVGAVWSTIREGADAIDQYNDLAVTIGVTEQSLQKMKLTAAMGGVEFDTVTNSISKLNKNIGDLRNGSATMADGVGKAFTRAGVSKKELETLNTEQLVNKTMVGLGKIKDQASRTATAMELFGKSGAKLQGLFGADALSGAADDLQRLGVQLTALDLSRVDAMNSNFDRIGVTIEGVKMKLASSFAPLLAAISEFAVTKIAELNASIEGGLSGGFDRAAKVATHWAGVIVDAFMVAKSAGALWIAAQRIQFNALKLVLNSAIAGWFALGKKILEFVANTQKTISGLAKTTGEIFKAVIRAVAAGIEGLVNTTLGGVKTLTNATIKGLNGAISGINTFNPLGNLPTIPEVEIESVTVDPSKITNALDTAVSGVDALLNFELPTETFEAGMDKFAGDAAQNLKGIESATADAATAANSLGDAWNELNSDSAPALEKMTDAQIVATVAASKHRDAIQDAGNASVIALDKTKDKTEKVAKAAKATAAEFEKIRDIVNDFDINNEAAQSYGRGAGGGDLGRITGDYERAIAKIRASENLTESERRQKTISAISYAQAQMSEAERLATSSFRAIDEYGRITGNSLSKTFEEFCETGKFNFKSFTASILSDLAKLIAKQAIFNSLSGFAQRAGGAGGGLFRGFLSSFASFDGGGFTGSGGRSGGVDGKGGFFAVLHPNETVIDHTRGGGGASQKSVVVNQQVIIREQMGAGQAAAIANQARAATLAELQSINARGGSRRLAFGMS